MRPLRLGTRGSQLAMRQATLVADLLRPLVVPRMVELVTIETAGDHLGDPSLAVIAGQGVFTKEIQRAVVAGYVDVAVHSLKDLPTAGSAGLVLAAVPPRGPPGDVLVSRRFRSFDQLPAGAVFATGSLRRQAQVLHRRPDLRPVPIRGNVETRLRKLQEGNFDALILAQAGLERLDLGQVITEILDPSWMLPAAGQGALGLECRLTDRATLALVAQVNDRSSEQSVRAERAFLQALGGGCQVPIGALGMITNGQLTLRGAVLTSNGQKRIDGRVVGDGTEAESLGCQLAEDVLNRGARELLPATCLT